MSDYRHRAPPGVTRRYVAALRKQKHSFTEIAALLGLSRQTVIYHLRRLGMIKGHAYGTKQLYRCPKLRRTQPLPGGAHRVHRTAHRMTSSLASVRTKASLQAEKNMAKQFLALCEREGVPEPMTQHRFDGARKWTMDFCWWEYLVALEVDGGLFVTGAHASRSTRSAWSSRRWGSREGPHCV